MIRRRLREYRARRAGDAILRRIERDVRVPRFPQRDGWQVVGVTHDLARGDIYGPHEERMSVELRRVV